MSTTKPYKRLVDWKQYVLTLKVEAVAPITRHNTGLLPEVETLVRSSEPPPSQQQTELLRAAGQRPVTPAEELLRATQENRRDV